MDRQRVEQILSRFSGKTILVVGDIMLDEFIWGKVQRISPEAPVPVVEVVNETYHLGGSGNVAANLRELGGSVIPVGVIGQDAAADRILYSLKESGIETSGLIRQERTTTVKTRIIAQNQQVVRTDRETRTALSIETSLELAAATSRFLNDVSG